MIRIFIITLIQGLLPIIPCLFSYHQGIDKVITPWPLLVLFIFFFNVFIILKFWKYLGYTKSERQGEAILLFVAAFVPFLTYKAIESNENLTLTSQIVCYCIGQISIWGTIVWAPEISGYFLERHSSKMILSGQKKLLSRKEFLENRKHKTSK